MKVLSAGNLLSAGVLLSFGSDGSDGHRKIQMEQGMDEKRDEVRNRGRWLIEYAFLSSIGR